MSHWRFSLLDSAANPVGIERTMNLGDMERGFVEVTFERFTAEDAERVNLVHFLRVDPVGEDNPHIVSLSVRTRVETGDWLKVDAPIGRR